jgi:hypothetical protein
LIMTNVKPLGKVEIPSMMLSQNETLKDGWLKRLGRTIFPTHSVTYSYRVRRAHDDFYTCNGRLPRAPLSRDDAVGMLMTVAEEYAASVRPLDIEMVVSSVTVKGNRRTTDTVYGPTLYNI